MKKLEQQGAFHRWKMPKVECLRIVQNPLTDHVPQTPLISPLPFVFFGEKKSAKHQRRSVHINILSMETIECGRATCTSPRYSPRPLVLPPPHPTTITTETFLNRERYCCIGQSKSLCPLNTHHPHHHQGWVYKQRPFQIR